MDIVPDEKGKPSSIWPLIVRCATAFLIRFIELVIKN